MRRLLFLFSLLCCFGSSIASPSTLAESGQSKFILSIGPDGTVTGSYTENEHAIYIEALRGEKNAEEDPSILPYALDIRILDEDKIPFLVQNNGVSQGFGDIEWASVLENPDDFARQHAIQMLPNAIRYMRATLESDSPRSFRISRMRIGGKCSIFSISCVPWRKIFPQESSGKSCQPKGRLRLPHTHTSMR